MKIFFNTTISNFCKFEPNLNVMISIFNFAAYREFAMVIYLFPINSIVRYIFDTFGSSAFQYLRLFPDFSVKGKMKNAGTFLGKNCTCILCC